MTTAKKVKGTAVSMPVGITIGVLTSLLVTGVLAAILTWGVLTGKTDEKSIGYFSMAIIFAASVSGTLLSAEKIKRRWMLVCCLTGGIYYAFLLGSTALFFGGSYQGIGVSGLMILIGSLASGMLGLNKGRRGEKRYKKYHSC